jgi:carbamoyl-phosphate synthase large subunit
MTPPVGQAPDRERNVLIFPGGTEIGLEIRQSLATCKEIRLFSAAEPTSSHAPYVYAVHDEVPGMADETWFDALRAVIQRRSIDYVFGAHEDVLLELSRRRDELGATLIAPVPETVEIARSKRRTYEALGGTVRVPVTYTAPFDNLAFPVFVKPDRGAGSRAADMAATLDELEKALHTREEMIVTEYLPGQEYTVDCFSDRDLGLLYCAPRLRVRTRNGISMDSQTVSDARVLPMAESIGSVLPMRGPWFFQTRETEDGSLCLIEVAARIAGTMALHRCDGVNFPLLGIYEEERAPITIMANGADIRIDRALVNRYQHHLKFSAVYVDLDDTLILRGQVNTVLVRLLYQFVNQGKRVVLITRSETRPFDTLRSFRLDGLPDEVIHLPRHGSKADIMDRDDAIFIDDSFGERVDVHRRTGIPTFDCSMIEMLLDDRA